MLLLLFAAVVMAVMRTFVIRLIMPSCLLVVGLTTINVMIRIIVMIIKMTIMIMMVVAIMTVIMKTIVTVMMTVSIMMIK